jgi:excisionase family DNA binding protein
MALPRSEALAQSPLRLSTAKEECEEVLGLEETGRILDMHPHEVSGLAREGKLRARRMGTRWRFHRSDVLDYLGRLSQIDKSI